MAGAYRTGSEIIRCASKNARVTGRADLMIAGPKLMFGTRCPSITSRCKKSAPPLSTSSISLPSLAKFADRIDARIWGLVKVNGSVVTWVSIPEHVTSTPLKAEVIGFVGREAHCNGYLEHVLNRHRAFRGLHDHFPTSFAVQLRPVGPDDVDVDDIPFRVGLFDNDRFRRTCV